MRNKVDELVNEIKTNLTQTSSSNRDEERVMRAMLNDREYKVGVYTKEGMVGEYCPAEDVRSMLTTVIANTVKISQEEAKSLADNHEFKKSESQTMVNLSKEFVNSYLQTGRKLPLGGREKSDVSLSRKEIPDSIVTYPKRVGVNADGSVKYENGKAEVKAHESVRVHSSCPKWIK